MVQPIILAAGKGTRMNNPDLPKVLVPLKGKPVISYILDTLAESSFQAPAIVVGYLEDKVRAALGPAYTYVTQAEQLGTGHAIAVCEEDLRGKSEVLLVMCGDMPLLTLEAMEQLVSEHQRSGAVLSLSTLHTDNPAFYNFGRIIRDENGNVAAIREYKDASEEERAIKEVNPGLYCFSDAWVWNALRKIDRANAQGEYYITDLLAIAVEEGQTVASVEMDSWQQTLGINTPEQLAEVEKWI